MIVYNITVNISYQAENDWLHYMKSVYLPEINATELPLECKLLRLLTEIENEGSTYTTQFTFRTMEDFLAYQTHFQPALQERHHELFNGQYVSFRTLLEEA
ncbi:hypothetical protein J2Y45_005203 [Dyadobacter sp. BE34]|uniref:DUF4286 domain-containing protein n=1 Tax=Dyadobacter fermentans TaxID=94254 RepID=A0ABU1R4V3_9BACT|nr:MULTISPECIES: DUF4286 family protein [Dyadobacter]MDR6808447.1 hypothetical protein [Dyadobacter fermentans]MDR7045736.1 hypothetical protein [Dyadobacter sp. BE242]MDR7200049.1 hypothetical protein [Dyadobacter sp. BE34]MDR7218009.1 hypothetical protein [Dyadobacter sp. BE31]MDR7265940.1 hypothetical protein [Dyadobacter sp. BE32]